MSELLLSICIPTYNRAEILRDTLEHYTSCEEFDESVEIVISDNASTDSTPFVCEEFTSKYPNVRYYRNAQNVKDENFVIVQDYASGDYIKLMNDNIYMPNEALGLMKQYIRFNSELQTPLFFVTAPVFHRIRTYECVCHSLDEYVQKVSLFVTAISMFGIWSSDWEKILNKKQYTKLQLSQVDWTYQSIERKGICKLVYMEPFWSPSKGTEKKFSEGYDFFQVHLVNYNIIKQVYADKGLISASSMNKDGRVFLQHYRKKLGEVLILRKQGVVGCSNTMRLLKKYYARDWYFYWYLISFPLWYLSDFGRRINNRIRRSCAG